MVTENSGAGNGAVMQVILASGTAERLAAFADGLWKGGKVELFQAATKMEVERLLNEREIGLVVIDREVGDVKGTELLEFIAKNNPFVNTALVSELTHEDFHEETEGMGVLMQLASPPAKEEALQLLDHVATILALHSA